MNIVESLCWKIKWLECLNQTGGLYSSVGFNDNDNMVKTLVLLWFIILFIT